MLEVVGVKAKGSVGVVEEEDVGAGVGLSRGVSAMK